MYRGSDSVFRISLTGIAFIFFFFLLVVLGWSSHDARSERDVAVKERNLLQAKNDDPQLLAAFEAASQELRAQLASSGANADDVIKRLTDKARAERDLANARALAKSLQSQVNGLTDVKETLTKAGGGANESVFSALALRARLEGEVRSVTGGDAATRIGDEEILAQTLAAFEFRRDLERRLQQKLGGQVVVAGQEAAWMGWLIDGSNATTAPGGAKTSASSARSTEAAPRAALSEQAVQAAVGEAPPVDIASLPTRYGPQTGGGSSPCWVDTRTNEVAFLLTIELRRNDVVVKRAWPDDFNAIVQGIPGLAGLLDRPLSHDEFRRLIAPVAKHSGEQCQYAVQVRENMRSGRDAERAYRQLEPLFHVVQLPR